MLACSITFHWIMIGSKQLMLCGCRLMANPILHMLLLGLETNTCSHILPVAKTSADHTRTATVKLITD